MVATPVRRVVQYFLMDGSSSKQLFRPTWALFPLCIPFMRLHIHYSGRVGTVEYGSWDINKPDVQQVLIEHFEQQVLPIFGATHSLADFNHVLATNRWTYHIRLWPSDLILIEAALGNFDAARAIWTDELSKWTERHYLHFDADPENMRRRQALGACLMSHDRAGVAAILRDCEAYSVKHMKLEKIWERTPFPCEL
jgi:hypothetical protein